MPPLPRAWRCWRVSGSCPCGHLEPPLRFLFHVFLFPFKENATPRSIQMPLVSQGIGKLHHQTEFGQYLGSLSFQRFLPWENNIAGQDNLAADVISRNNLSLFYSLVPRTAPTHSCHTVRLGYPSESPARLGLTDVDSFVVSFVLCLIANGISEASNSVYQSGWRRCIRFCNEFSVAIDPLPFMERSPLQQYSHSLALWGGKPFVHT